MEILRFNDAGTSSPQRKKSSRGALAIGLVATLFGISSAFASSTITINSDAAIALGQGVSAVAACDSAIGLTPSTQMYVETGTPTFFLTSLAITGVNSNATDTTTAVGCGGKTLEIQIFDGSNTAYNCSALQVGTVNYSFGGSGATTCLDSKISFAVPVVTGPESNYIVSLDKAPSVISYITLVSRES